MVRKVFYGCFLVASLWACTSPSSKEEKNETHKKSDSAVVKTDTVASQTPQNPYKNAQIEVKIVDSNENTFGYEIWVEGQKIIYQPTIPSMAGNKGFKSKEQAQKVADLVVSKIRKNQMPPSVSPEELDSLGILK